jgi:hypothetical protein
MALDFTLLGPDGRPERRVALSVADHTSLIVLAERHGLPLLTRFRDYYEDGIIDLHELETLDRELAVLAALPDAPPPVLELRALADEARASRREIRVLAD